MANKKVNNAASLKDAQATISAAQAKAEQIAREKAAEQAALLSAAIDAYRAVTSAPLASQRDTLADALDAVKTHRAALAAAMWSEGWQARVLSLVASIDSQMQACATQAQAEAHLLCVRLSALCTSDADTYNDVVVALSALAQRMPTASKVSPIIARELRLLKELAATARKAQLDVSSVASKEQLADYKKQAELREQRASERRAKLLEMQAAMLPSAGASTASEQGN